MICPKCGYSQEERLDCKKCGVVFSKYYALHPEAAQTSTQNDEAPAATAVAASNDLHPREIEEFREHLKDLNRVFNEFEFERAERNRIRGEIKVLDQKIQDLLKDFSERFEALSANDAPTSSEVQVQPDPSSLQRMQELEGRLSDIEEAVRAIPTNPAPPAAGSLAVELDTLFKEIEDLRTSLQNVTVRYSEIGELKKNHLVLANRLDSLAPEIATAKESSSRGGSTKKIAGLEQEVTALRAELRQTMEQIETAGGGGSAAGEGIQALQKEVQRLSESITASDAQNKNDIAVMTARFDSGLSEITGLREDVRSLGSAIQGLEKQRIPLEEGLGKIRELEEKVASLINQGPLPPLEEDVHAIRVNLEGLLRRLNQSA